MSEPIDSRILAYMREVYDQVMVAMEAEAFGRRDDQGPRSANAPGPRDVHKFCREIGPRPPLTQGFLEQMDPGIVGAVIVLADHGIETCQSCEGGPGHSYPYPTVDFLGGPAAGFAAVSIAVQHGLRPLALSHVWPLQGDDLDAPVWRLEFRFPFAPGTYEPRVAS